MGGRQTFERLPDDVVGMVDQLLHRRSLQPRYLRAQPRTLNLRGTDVHDRRLDARGQADDGPLKLFLLNRVKPAGGIRRESGGPVQGRIGRVQVDEIAPSGIG